MNEKNGDRGILLDFNSLSAEELSESQLEYLDRINNKLFSLEKIMLDEYKNISLLGDQRVLDSKDWVSDYEIDNKVSFYLKESDALYDEAEENILFEISYYPYLSSCAPNGTNFMFDYNYNEFKSDNHPMKMQKHCRLYYYLYCGGIGWANILRVGTIWLDISIEYQHCIDL